MHSFGVVAHGALVVYLFFHLTFVREFANIAHIRRKYIYTLFIDGMADEGIVCIVSGVQVIKVSYARNTIFFARILL